MKISYGITLSKITSSKTTLSKITSSKITLSKITLSKVIKLIKKLPMTSLCQKSPLKWITPSKITLMETFDKVIKWHFRWCEIRRSDPLPFTSLNPYQPRVSFRNLRRLLNLTNIYKTPFTYKQLLWISTGNEWF